MVKLHLIRHTEHEKGTPSEVRRPRLVLYYFDRLKYVDFRSKNLPNIPFPLQFKKFGKAAHISYPDNMPLLGEVQRCLKGA